MLLDPQETRARLVAWHRLDHPFSGTVPELLTALRCIQLDPLDPIGTNADLVAHARIDGLHVGDVYRDLLPTHAFEHYAKERCLLPAARFAHYRDEAVEKPWWRATRHMKRVDEPLLAEVLTEIGERGPLLASELTERGRVDPIDWSGWKGSSRAAKLALEVLWRRCEVVVHERTPAGKRWSLPGVSLGADATRVAEGSFDEVCLLDRVAAIGLLPTAGGPWWSMLSDVRKGPLPRRLLEEGRLVEVGLPGTRKRWLADRRFLELSPPPPDDRMRILGPLDPMMWDRDLVERVFGFTYLWEVYKPAAKRRWGWYVCPLLHRGQLVGRIDAKRGDGAVVIKQVWREHPDFDDDALDAAIARLERFLFS